MSNKALCAEFHELNKDQVTALGWVIADFCQDIYATRKCLVQPDEYDVPVVIVAVDGAPGAGKSTLTARCVLKNIALEPSDGDIHCINLVPENGKEEEGRIITCWESYWSDHTQQHNTRRDCFLTEPFKSKDVDIVCKQPPMRQYSGIEVLEHPGRIPEEAIAVHLDIEVTESDLRHVTICVKNNFSDKIADEWNLLINDVQNLKILSTPPPSPCWQEDTQSSSDPHRPAPAL